MKKNFDKCLGLVPGYEGGYVNDPQDPGGATNQGITQKTYTAWLGTKARPWVDVREITHEDISAIYRDNFWARAHCDELPSGLDLAVFDYAVNSGVSRAASDLQRGLGCTVDGVIGVGTLAAVASKDAGLTVGDLCNRRLAFLRTLKTWGRFGAGWSRRVANVRAQAAAMIGDGPEPADPASVPVTGAAKAPQSDQSALKTQQGAGLTTAGIGTAGQTLMAQAQNVQPHITDHTLGRAAFALFGFLTIAGVLLLALSYYRKLQEAGGLGGLIGSIK